MACSLPPHQDVANRLSPVLSDELALIRSLSLQYSDDSLSDLKLRVGARIFAVHRFVLACSSDVFRSMLYGNRWTESTTVTPDNTVDLQETTECEMSFDAFLRFFYSASVRLDPQNVAAILCLADKYNVEALRVLCLRYMLDNCKSQGQDNVKNAINWYPLSVALNLKDLTNQTRSTIEWNATAIMTSPQWQTMELDFLRDVLASSHLVVLNEYTIFDAVQRWLLAEAHITQRSTSAVAGAVLPLVRFSQMTVLELSNCEQSSLAKEGGSACGEILGHLLGKAYRFHALCSVGYTAARVACDDSAFYSPRDYLDMQVDSERMQNAVRFGMVVEVKTRSGPAADDRREAEWRLSYRRTDRAWTLQIQCLDQRMSDTDGECCSFRTTVILHDEADQILQVVRAGALPCRRGSPYSMEIFLNDPSSCRQMAVLLKPCIY